MTCDKCKESAEKYRELREAVEAVIGHARPHYNRGRVVSGEAMERLAKTLDLALTYSSTQSKTAE